MGMPAVNDLLQSNRRYATKKPPVAEQDLVMTNDSVAGESQLFL